MLADAGYEANDDRFDSQISTWGANLAALVHSNLLAPTPKHVIFLASCLRHCGGGATPRIRPSRSATSLARVASTSREDRAPTAADHRPKLVIINPGQAESGAKMSHKARMLHGRAWDST